jgi:hypothetical protein
MIQTLLVVLFVLGVFFFDPEDAGSMFLRNAIVLQLSLNPRRSPSSQSAL